MKGLKKVKKEIILFVLTILWIFMATHMGADNLFEYIVAKICELMGKGFLLWLLSGWFLCKSKNPVAGTVLVIMLGLALTWIPQYVEIVIWTVSDNSLPWKDKMEIAHSIFINKAFGDYVWRSLFWPLYYVAIYHIRRFFIQKEEVTADDSSNR